MAKKKKRSVLPRVTVLAYNRRELATFAAAVEQLGAGAFAWMMMNQSGGHPSPLRWYSVQTRWYSAPM